MPAEPTQERVALALQRVDQGWHMSRVGSAQEDAVVLAAEVRRLGIQRRHPRQLPRPPLGAATKALDQLADMVVALEQAARDARAALAAYLGGRTPQELDAWLVGALDGSPIALAIRAMRGLDEILDPPPRHST